MTHDSSTGTPKVTPSGRSMAPSTRHITRVNADAYRYLIDMAGISNAEMARATGMSESYAAQVSSGTRVRVNTDFLDRAAAYIAARLSEPVVVMRVLVSEQ